MKGLLPNAGLIGRGVIEEGRYEGTGRKKLDSWLRHITRLVALSIANWSSSFGCSPTAQAVGGRVFFGQERAF
jgi:hypothetical protein